ncbi:MAG: Sec-dependent nitrous-oxide reductase [Acidobacteria bacterium]|nr:Sec-dependent nitrous-oxide reductase [Thermoanaerobaculia bacterium]NLN11682.1 Sec-dependent nitrous-oxide reductase [Acidobacteriota bacterium]MBP7814245.1 Sec-dependent nitrous-oxide reductase [Thermoanaerobaculia bacterium]HPA96446.1 Sec-dependent nitrous-oxide reductase [Thermoanaerobaculia bacterium]HRR14776.1 Sec-dependent nitrous-oxide reductase [Thermoanaerobaculia bacterium]
MKRFLLAASPLLVLALLLVVGQGCGGRDGAIAGASADIQKLMKDRNLNEENVVAALKTYTPTGVHDEYYIFASGGHSGQVIVIGVPSMRILKYIAVFTPEPWQGYGYGDQTTALLRSGDRDGRELNWADTHHPALSETDGTYDGQYLFINDKANARVAVISLEDFTAKQIVFSELLRSDHGAAFVTPNTEYVIESGQYPVPLGGEFVPIEQYQEKYRSAVLFWKFDREKGRIDTAKSFAIELPPYMQDLADSGKLASDGWMFINSLNTEMAFGGNLEGRPPLESGASQNDMDYLHVINWRKAEEVVNAGKFETVAGTRLIRLPTAIEEGLLHFVGEPKSPHGVDVTPDGREIVVSGKLDTHTTVYSFEKIKGLIEQQKYAGKDPFGIPILPFEEAIRGQAEIGLGPLHTQFDGNGYAYTSLFIESAAAKWSLADLKVVEKIPVHYNIGHILVAGGDTVKPDGRYLVAMNKWALDRFGGVGPLLPQNFQLIDIAGEKMQLLADLPIPLGEPHYAQMIKADKIKSVNAYTPIGIDPVTDQVDPYRVVSGEEGIERKADGVHVRMTAVRSHFTPDTIRVKKGDIVHLHLTNVEQAHDATHGFSIAEYNINSSLEPGEHVNITFKADRAGVFPFYCTEFCSALHLEMAGYLLVEP